MPTRFLRPRGGKLAPTARPRATWPVKFLHAVGEIRRFDRSNLGGVSCRTTSHFWFPLLSLLHCPQSLVAPWLRSLKESPQWGSYAKDRPSSSMTARVQSARSRRLPVAITSVLAGPSTFSVHISAFRDNGWHTMVRWSVARFPKRVICDRVEPAASRAMSASLIGRLGSSTFRLSTTTVSMSLTGSCFSSESAPRPFHYGIRRRGGTIYATALPSHERQVQADMRTHLIHRPARDIIPPLGGTRVSFYWI